MTPFETQLQVLIKQLTTTKQQEVNNRWAAVKAGELAKYNAEQDKLYNNAIATMKAQYEKRKADKEAELKAKLEEEVNVNYDQIQILLEKLTSLIKSNS